MSLSSALFQSRCGQGEERKVADRKVARRSKGTTVGGTDEVCTSEGKGIIAH